jgi:hypothetical protein
VRIFYRASSGNEATLWAPCIEKNAWAGRITKSNKTEQKSNKTDCGTTRTKKRAQKQANDATKTAQGTVKNKNAKSTKNE